MEGAREKKMETMLRLSRKQQDTDLESALQRRKNSGRAPAPPPPAWSGGA